MTTKTARRPTKPHPPGNHLRTYPLRRSEKVWAEVAERTAMEPGILKIESYPFGYLMRCLSDLLMARKVVVGGFGVVLVALNGEEKVLAACDVPPMKVGGSDWDPGMVAAIGKVLCASRIILGLRMIDQDLSLPERTRDLISRIQKALRALGLDLHDVVAYNESAFAGGLWPRLLA